MTKTILMLVIPLLLFTACHKSEAPCSEFSLENGTITSQEEYLILKAILNEYHSDTDNFHILQESHSMADSSSFEKYLINEEVIFDAAKKAEYITLNSTPYSWGPIFIRKKDLMSSEEFNCLFASGGNGWQAYYDKYENSKGILKIGKPILDKNRAIITYDHLCGFLCGYGFTVILKKENNKWKIENRVLIWIS